MGNYKEIIIAKILENKRYLALGFTLLFLVLYLVKVYNRFIVLDAAVANQLAQVEVQYQRRFDLIPRLLESVKGLMTQEKEVFGEIAEARTRYSGATTADQKISAASSLDSSLSRLLMVVEKYPDLKSSESVQMWMVSFEGTENRISVERKRYNDLAMEFNVAIRKFPSGVIAGLFNFQNKTYFEADKLAAKAPEIKF